MLQSLQDQQRGFLKYMQGVHAITRHDAPQTCSAAGASSAGAGAAGAGSSGLDSSAGFASAAAFFSFFAEGGFFAVDAFLAEGAFGFAAAFFPEPASHTVRSRPAVIRSSSPAWARARFLRIPMSDVRGCAGS